MRWQDRYENCGVSAVSGVASDSESANAGWPAWAQAVCDALDRENLSINAAATLLGVRNTTLKKWLDGTVAPQLTLLPRFAELTGISHALQLELGGVLPPGMRADAHAIQVADELRSVMGRVSEVVARAGELAFSDAGARIAGILLSAAGPELQITLRRVYRGRRYPVHLTTYVGVQSLSRENPLEDNALRRRVAEVIGDSGNAFGARWREQVPHDWETPRPPLILTIPQHERSRPPSVSTLGAAPNVLVLGCPYAHAEYIGALLADALGYGYIDLRYSVPLQLDRSPDDPLLTAARVQFTRNLLADGELTYKHVWSIADQRVLPAVADSLADADVACVIYVRSGAYMLAQGSEVWGVPVAEMLRVRGLLDQVVENAIWPVITLSLPDELVSDDADGALDADRIADVAMLAAVDAWRYLANYGFVPRPTAALGRLRTMFDDRGRPTGDPRPLLVTEARRMPPRH
jgi:hypothetical protein